MINDFQDAIKKLCQRFSLEKPKNNEGIFSLKVGEQGIHITEYPKNKILMFAHIEQAKIDGHTTLFQKNMFSEVLLKPVLSQEDNTNDWVLWNRQDLHESSIETLYQQLELLSYSSDELLMGSTMTQKEKSSKGAKMDIRHCYKN